MSSKLTWECTVKTFVSKSNKTNEQTNKKGLFWKEE